MASSNKEGWPGGFRSRPPPQGIIFWACVVVVMMLTHLFWPTVAMLLVGGVHAYRRLTRPQVELPRPEPRRRVQRPRR